MIDRLDAQLDIQRKALGALTYRQELLASNIANADTPNYKARDVDFKGMFAKALAGRGGDLSLARTSARHLGGGAGAGNDAFSAAVKFRTEFQPNVDGNTVNMDVERAAFADNAMRMEAALTFVRSQFSSLQQALQSQ